MYNRNLIIIELYTNGYRAEEIAVKCNCSIGTVYNVLKKNSIKTRDSFGGIKTDLRNQVIQMYLNFESVNSIKNKLGITQSKINRILKEGNVPRISQSKRNNPHLIEDYFTEINDVNKAYWVGWLITDGSLLDKDHSISISLQKGDQHILEVLQKDLQIDNKIKPFNGDYVKFYFSCKSLYTDLLKYGLKQNKTFDITIPELDDSLYPALLRGCFEGDGGLSILNSRGKEELELSFTGNIYTVTKFNELISKFTGIKLRKITKNNSIYRIRWSNKQEIITILTFLYKDCGEHKLDRKYNKYLQILGNTEINSEIKASESS